MPKRKKPKFDTPAMKRFEELGRKLFSTSKPLRPKEPEEDTEEVMEGGVEPTERVDVAAQLKASLKPELSYTERNEMLRNAAEEAKA